LLDSQYSEPDPRFSEAKPSPTSSSEEPASKPAGIGSDYAREASSQPAAPSPANPSGIDNDYGRVNDVQAAATPAAKPTASVAPDASESDPRFVAETSVAREPAGNAAAPEAKTTPQTEAGIDSRGEPYAVAAIPKADTAAETFGAKGTEKQAIEPALDHSNGRALSSKDWAAYDQRKAELGGAIPVAKSEVSANYGKVVGGSFANDALSSIQGDRARALQYQKAVNDAYNEIYNTYSDGPGPSILQDGKIGSRTKSATYDLMKNHPEIFQRALQKNGFR
jgi:hypothetical protein